MWNWQLLRAGALRLDGGGMFGVIPRTIWSRLVTPDKHNRIPLQTNCLLLRDGTQTVLVETGCGDKWTDTQRGHWDLERRTVVDALREAGTEPEQIDFVIVTHLHFDPAAALTRWDDDGQPVPTFPNATVVTQEVEWTDALANKSTMGRTYLRSHLDPVADRVRRTVWATTCSRTRTWFQSRNCWRRRRGTAGGSSWTTRRAVRSCAYSPRRSARAASPPAPGPTRPSPNSEYTR